MEYNTIFFLLSRSIVDYFLKQKITFYKDDFLYCPVVLCYQDLGLCDTHDSLRIAGILEKSFTQSSYANGE